MPAPVLPLVAAALVYGVMHVGLEEKGERRLAGAAARRRRKAKAARRGAGEIDLGRLARDVVGAMLLTDRSKLHAGMDDAAREASDREDRRNKRQMALSAGAFGVAVGAAVVPALTPVAIGSVLFLMRDTAALLWRDIRRGHYLSLYAISAAVTLGMLATGHVILAAFAAFMEGLFSRIINRLEESSQQRLTTVFTGHLDKVWIVKDGVEIEIPCQDVSVGDRVRISAGEIIPVDGRIVEGFALIDERILTGESQPVDKEPGARVFASTLLLSGRITVEVMTAGDDTIAAKIAQTLQETQSYKDTVMLRGRAIADRFVPAKLTLAGTAAIFVNPRAALALMRAEMGEGLCISGPMSVMTYLQLLAQQQILVKDGRVFEALRSVDTVVFDKTGTLTEEEPTLGTIHVFNGFDPASVLRLAAAAEQRQPHPIARAIRARAEADGLEPLSIDEATYELGYGVQVGIGGRTIRVGSARFLEREGLDFPPGLALVQAGAEAESHSLVYVAVDGKLAGVLEMEPTIRPEAREIVAALKEMEIDLYIISGDHEAPTRKIAETLGVAHYFAETLPENKADHVKRLRAEGRFVCFVGDGINDAIALQAAQVSISLKGASSAATDTAQILFMDGSLRNLPYLFEMVDEFEDSMRRNMVFSFAPGLFTIGGALFFKFGIATAMAIQYVSIFGELVSVFWPLAKHQRALPAPDQAAAPESDAPENAAPATPASTPAVARSHPDPSRTQAPPDTRPSEHAGGAPCMTSSRTRPHTPRGFFLP